MFYLFVDLLALPTHRLLPPIRTNEWSCITFPPGASLTGRKSDEGAGVGALLDAP
jgi:hypothetical protein